MMPGERPADIFGPAGNLRDEVMTREAQVSLRESLRLTHETRWDTVRSPHVFMGLLAAPDLGIRKWGERLRADLPRLLAQFQELFHQEDGEEGSPLALHREFFSDNVIRLLREAQQRAQENHRHRITSMDLLISLLTSSNSIVAECFERIGVTAARLTELAVLAEHACREEQNQNEQAQR